jgi:signal transduction histidine kinase
MIAAGLAICDRRPGNRLGPLAVLTGFVWFAGDFTSSNVAVVAYLADVLHGWFDPLFAIVILAYPTGRLLRPIDRWLALGFIAVQGAWTVAKAYAERPIAWWDCPTCIGTVDSYIAAQQALDPLGRLETAALTALSIGVLVAVATRWARASGTARRRQTPVVLAGIVLVLGFTGGFLLQTVIPTDARTPAGELRVVILAILRVLVAVALLIGILRDDAARGRIADLVITLERLPPVGVLQDSLRDALGDPSLEVVRWDPDAGHYLDAAGQRAAPPVDGPERAALTIENDGVPMLAIAYDPALRDDPGLVSAAVAAVRLSVENERLQAEVRAQLEAVSASRARLAEAQDTERRRIERDLHDGAQQRLVSLRISLELLRKRLGADADPAILAELDAASAEAQAAIGDVRELAQGLHPAILAEAGLGRALESLAERSPVDVDVRADLDGRLPPAVEATAYFVVAEALTNTAKHAVAQRATVTARQADGRLRIEIVDDGVGGADIEAGTGLRGLEDRVAALGGTLRVDSRPGTGTAISVELPCASS